MGNDLTAVNSARASYGVTKSKMDFYLPQEFRTQDKKNKQSSNGDTQINPGISSWELSTTEGIFDVTPYDGDKISDIVRQHAETSVWLYEKMIESGVCREQARAVLPQSMYTCYYGTANLRNLLHFVDLRIDPHAQQEIQVVARAVLNFLERLYPQTIDAYLENKDWHWS